jgi:hypothetical protein
MSKYLHSVFGLVARRSFVVSGYTIFRLPKIGGLYVSSEVKEDGQDLFRLYHRNGLRGVYLKKLWDEVDGPDPGACLRAAGDGC